MLLQELKNFAELLADKLPPPGYDEFTVHRQIDLDSQGKLLTRDVKEVEIDNVQLPYSGIRTGDGEKNPKPALLADFAEYVLGIDKDDKIKFEKFREQVKNCADATGVASVRAVYEFLKNGPFLDHRDFAQISKKERIQFWVNGYSPTEEQKVKNYWVTVLPHGEAGTCMVCGVQDTVLENLPIGIRTGIRNVGVVPLISARKDSFQSYGQENSLNAPMCRSCAEKTHKAINYMSKARYFHFSVSNSALYVFWVRGMNSRIPGGVLRGKVAAIQAMLEILRKPRSDISMIEESQFYLLALTGNKGRIAIRQWIDISLHSVYENLKLWIDHQSLKQVYGKETYLSLQKLIESWKLSKKKEKSEESKNIPIWVSTAFTTNALEGKPLPLPLLIRANRLFFHVFRDIKTDIKPTKKLETLYLATKYVKFCLINQSNNPELVKEISMEHLDENYPEPAYHYGRMFSVLEYIQYCATETRNIESMIVAAASNPTVILTRLLIRSRQAHLSKILRNDPRKGKSLQSKLAGIEGKIKPENIKAQLSDARAQALFILGYYHQLLHDFEAGLEKNIRNAALETKLSTEI